MLKSKHLNGQPILKRRVTENIQWRLYGWTGVMADPDNFLYPNLSSTNVE